MRGRKHNLYSSLEENTHTTDLSFIDTLGENWKIVEEDDENIYFISEFGFLLKKNKINADRTYLFGTFENNEFYVSINGKKKTIAGIVASAFFKETRKFSKWSYLYKNRDPRDPSAKNLMIINENEKDIDAAEKNEYLKRMLKMKPVVIKENREKRHRKDNSVYEGTLLGFSNYRKYVCYARRFDYFFSPDGDGYREENKSNHKYQVKFKEKDGQIYTKVGSDEILLANIVFELFGENVPDNYYVTFKDGNPKNVNIENLDCVELPKIPDNKKMGVFLQNLSSLNYNAEEDTPVKLFNSKQEASEFFQIPIKRFNDILNTNGEIKVKIKESPYYHYIREIQ